MSDEKAVPETLETIAKKITAMSKSIDGRFADVNTRFDSVDKTFDSVDKRFDEVTDALVEQRKSTEFAFQKLRAEMTGGFGRLDRKLDRVLEALPRTPPPRRRRRS